MRPPSPLDELGLALFADLYRALAPMMTPTQVDECELWQLAALLGGDRVESQDPIDRLAAQIERDRESLARRAGVDPANINPPSEPLGERPKMVDVTAQIMASMGIQTE